MGPLDKQKILNQDSVGPFCDDEELLLIKATSRAALAGLERSLAIFQDFLELQRVKWCHKRSHHSKKSLQKKANNADKARSTLHLSHANTEMKEK